MSMKIQVDGMSCQHCIKSVTEAVQSVQSDARVQVDLNTGLVDIENGDTGRRSAIEEAIVDQGYEVKVG